ncbi:MAG: 4-hydroxythreonine-4-phosphate dehydrogenase PdxA, partial [Pseudomonadota bacterium]
MASPTFPITDDAVTPSRPLAISMGEPGGVGTELLFKAYRHFADFPPGKGPQFFLIDDPFRVEKLSRELDANIPIVTLRHPQETAEQFQHGLPILPLDEDMIDPLRKVKLGEASASTAKAVIASLDAAVTFVCDGTASSLVTLPIQKEALQEAGFSHPGHTDYLGELTKEIAMPKGMARGPVMLLTAGPFRVAPVTVHMPLSQVAPSLSADTIMRTGMVVAQSLARDYGILTPKIAVAGLNPHAGEGGMLGTEDENIIAPAIATLRAQGVDAFGPLPGDTM